MEYAIFPTNPKTIKMEAANKMSKHNPWDCVLCTTAEAAEYLGRSTSWLEHDRMSDTPNVKFVKQGHGDIRSGIRYRKADLNEYIKSLES